MNVFVFKTVCSYQKKKNLHNAVAAFVSLVFTMLFLVLLLHFIWPPTYTSTKISWNVHSKCPALNPSSMQPTNGLQENCEACCDNQFQFSVLFWWWRRLLLRCETRKIKTDVWNDAQNSFVLFFLWNDFRMLCILHFSSDMVITLKLHSPATSEWFDTQKTIRNHQLPTSFSISSTNTLFATHISNMKNILGNGSK